MNVSSWDPASGVNGCEGEMHSFLGTECPFAAVVSLPSSPSTGICSERAPRCETDGKMYRSSHTYRALSVPNAPWPGRDISFGQRPGVSCSPVGKYKLPGTGRGGRERRPSQPVVRPEEPWAYDGFPSIHRVSLMDH